MTAARQPSDDWFSLIPQRATVGISKCLNPFCIHLSSQCNVRLIKCFRKPYRWCPMPRTPGLTHIKPVWTVSNGLWLQISFRALWRYFCWQLTRLKVKDEGISHSLLYLRRFLSDWLGVLLHGGRGGGRHAAVRLAVLFRREEAEALPVLKRAPPPPPPSEAGPQKGEQPVQDGRGPWLIRQLQWLINYAARTHSCTHTDTHTHTALKTGSSLKSCSWMKNVWTNPTCKNVTSRIPLTKRVLSSLDSCLFIDGCFLWWCTLWWRKKSDITSL